MGLRDETNPFSQQLEDDLKEIKAEEKIRLQEIEDKYNREIRKMNIGMVIFLGTTTAIALICLFLV